MTLSLFLLGPFLATLGQDRTLDLTSTKAQALLAYLVIECDRRHYREAWRGALAAQPSDSARGSLRQAFA